MCSFFKAAGSFSVCRVALSEAVISLFPAEAEQMLLVLVAGSFLLF